MIPNLVFLFRCVYNQSATVWIRYLCPPFRLLVEASTFFSHLSLRRKFCWSNRLMDTTITTGPIAFPVIYAFSGNQMGSNHQTKISPPARPGTKGWRRDLGLETGVATCGQTDRQTDVCKNITFPLYYVRRW